jgi:UDP-3-O-[3-hydroxymyristoyl] glucosamine N-acyltransferase
MEIAANQLAILLDGQVEGDGDVLISKPAKIEEASIGAITFLANLKYEAYVYTTKASAILVSKDFKPKEKVPLTLIRVEDVYATIPKLLHVFGAAIPVQAGISSLAFLHTTADLGEGCSIGEFVSIQKDVQIGKNCIIYPHVYIGAGVIIGDNTILYSGVKIYHNCQIGNNCIVQANAVIGSDGFGFAPQTGGLYEKIPQVGVVIIEDSVEIGANTVVDRATMGVTIIKKGTKLDNLIQVAHNVEIGENTVIAAQAGIAGSTRIGSQCQIGGQAGFVGHIKVADKVRVQAQSGVAASIKEEGAKVYGYPALNYRDYLKAYALFRQLPELEKRIRALENKGK